MNKVWNNLIIDPEVIKMFGSDENLKEQNRNDFIIINTKEEKEKESPKTKEQESPKTKEQESTKTKEQESTKTKEQE